MTKQEIIEGNKLIVVFTGCVWFTKETGSPTEKLKYHSSWDWLMPVVEKIDQDFSEFELIIYSASCYIDKFNTETNKYDTFIFNTGNKLEAVWLTVVEFINYYNKIEK